MSNFWTCFYQYFTPRMENKIFFTKMVTGYQIWVREDLKKKSIFSDIVTIDPPTYPTPPNSDTKFSDIFF